MSDQAKKPEVINGRRVGDEVGIYTGSATGPDGSRGRVIKAYTIRKIGIAGFQVKGLATCFYWHEKKITWDDLS